jgi:ABC-type lipoprotein release transport system permease subunit
MAISHHIRDLFSRQLHFLRLIVLSILLLSIGSGMSRNVLDRYREIGTMMAPGATRAQVGVKFAVETLIVGLVFGGIGVTIGALLALLISAIGIPMPPPPGTAHGFTAGISFSAGNALSAGLVGIAARLACIPSVVRARGCRSWMRCENEHLHFVICLHFVARPSCRSARPC